MDVRERELASIEESHMSENLANPAVAQRRPWRGPLAIASGALVLLFVLHGLDHVRQGLGRLTPEVSIGGQALMVAALTAFVLAVRRHPLTPAVAITVGLASALAVAASHLAPHWSAFSDSYPDNDLDVVAWASMLAVIAMAGILALVGINELRGASEARRNRRR